MDNIYVITAYDTNDCDYAEDQNDYSTVISIVNTKEDIEKTINQLIKSMMDNECEIKEIIDTNFHKNRNPELVVEEKDITYINHEQRHKQIIVIKTKINEMIKDFIIY